MKIIAILLITCVFAANCDRAYKVSVNDSYANWEISEGCINLRIEAFYVDNVGMRIRLNNINDDLAVELNQIKMYSDTLTLKAAYYLNEKKTDEKRIVLRKKEMLEVWINAWAGKALVYGKDVFECEGKLYDLDTLVFVKDR